MTTLVTGAAGFIGMHTVQALLARGETVVGLDNLNEYYSVDLKRARLALLQQHPNFLFVQADIADAPALTRVFETERPTHVVHLAAQAGVRYSVTNPQVYVQSNLVGFANLLEACRHGGVQHLVFASSSSVYGGNTHVPFSEGDNVDHPLSLYAATKKANELMAHTYAHLYRLPVTGLRFFTVYGPWGRPDMSPMLFARAIARGDAIDVFNHGNMQRDFTYVADIVEGVVRVLAKPATPAADFDTAHPDPATSHAPYRIFNIGNSQPVGLLDYIGALEKAMGRQARKNLREMQPGDVPMTAADTSALEAWVGFRPSTPLDVGLRHFVDWFNTCELAR
jgi:UDP-glucuronate 4-epimerase